MLSRVRGSRWRGRGAWWTLAQGRTKAGSEERRGEGSEAELRAALAALLTRSAYSSRLHVSRRELSAASSVEPSGVGPLVGSDGARRAI